MSRAGGDADPLLVDVVLGVMAAEFVWLWSRRGFAAKAAAGPLAAIGPGACLALALRFAMRGSPRWTIAAALAAAMPVHLADLTRRPVR
jgi:hypothetical protein